MTALFADLGGSTSFGERADAEIARVVMAQYHALLQSTIDAHGGTIAKFMGDGMMALFGVPDVAEDDALRAVRAGVDAQHRFETFAADVARRHGETLTLRVGINTGELVLADGDADLVGDVLNVAARLEKACAAGRVLVGEETWRLTRGDLGYEALGEVSVAGRAQAVAIFEVTDVDVERTERVAPFVGRDDEVGRLRSAFDRATSQRDAQLVTVLGSPGVGKTRLSREFVSRVGGERGARAVEIRCDRSGEATFAPIAQLVRQVADLDDDATSELVRERITALMPPGDDRARLVEVLAGVYGAASARSVEETFWAIRRLVESLASNQPFVVVIDDIQWAEPKLLDLLEHLAEWVDGAAVTLVGLARPELREVRAGLTEVGRRVADVIALDGLDHNATEQLAASLLGAERLPAGLVERLPASTNGNPLFVRELVRMLVDDAVIERGADGEWRLTIDAEAVEVPPTIQSLLASRVERLTGEERRVLELASVIGAELSLGALRALAGPSVAVARELESLRRKELLEPTGTYWGDEPMYRFHHVLIRDAAYRRLLKTARAELHQQVGAWMDAASEGVIGDHAAAIAFHFEQAHRYRIELGGIDDVTDALGARAAELFSAAAHRALGRDDLAAAGSLAARALRVIPSHAAATRAELLLLACECLFASGTVGDGPALVDELRSLSGGDAGLRAWADCFAAQLVGLSSSEGLVSAEASAAAAAEVFRGLGDGAGEAKAQQVRAGLLARLGRVGDAEAVLDLALGAARAADDRRRVTAVLGAAPQAALFGPSPVARAGGRCLDVVRLLRITTASPSVEATSLRCQAVLEALRGRYGVSRTMLATARATLEELGLRHGLLETDLFAGLVETISGEVEAAIAPLRRAYDGLGTLGVGADAGQAAALLARALIARGAPGDLAEADSLAAASEELAGQNLKTAIAWRLARAEVQAARGAVSDAVASARAAVDIAQRTDLVLDHADACTALAGHCARAGDAAGAAAARAEARRLYVLKGATVPADRVGVAPEAGERPEPITVAPVAIDRWVGSLDGGSSSAAHRAGVRMSELIAEGRTEEWSAMLAPGFSREDRRSIVSFGTMDATSLEALVDTSDDLGMTAAVSPPVASRGDHLSVARVTWRTTAGDEISQLVLVELDTAGLIAAMVSFDHDATDAASAELETRFAIGEGAAYAVHLRLAAELGRCQRARDFDGMRALLASTFRFVDHRRLGFGALDAAGYADLIASRDQVAQDRSVVVRERRFAGNASLAVVDRSVETPEGNRYARAVVVLAAFDDDQLITHLEYFDPESAWDAALARLAELGAETATGDGRASWWSPAENAAIRQGELMARLANADRFTDLAALLAPGFADLDRRTTVSFGRMSAATFVDALQASRAAGLVMVVGPIVATLGDRLAVRQITWRSDDNEIAFLSLGEFDAEGRFLAHQAFDVDAIDEAIAELDARFAAGEGAAFPLHLRLSDEFGRCQRERDFDGMRELLASSFRFADHRQIGFGALDPDGYIELLRAGDRVAMQVSALRREVRFAGNASLAVVERMVETPEGNRYGGSSVILAAGDGLGQITHVEYFDADTSWNAALARFAELAVDSTHRAELENAATRVGREFVTLHAARDTEGLAALLAAGFTSDDRRTAASWGVQHTDETLAMLRAGQEMGLTFTRGEWLAVRGDRLALGRSWWGTPAGDEIAQLQIFELDASGRACSLVRFDADRLDDAIAELDRRYVVGEGADHAAIFANVSASFRALAAPDFDLVRALAAPGWRYVDHRHLGLGNADLETFIGYQQAYGDVRHRFMITEVHARGRVMLVSVTNDAADTDDGAVEWRFLAIYATEPDKRVSLVEIFDPEDRREAFDRLEALGARRDAVEPRGAEGSAPEDSGLENAATRSAARFGALVNARRLDELGAMLAPGFAAVDHRSTVSYGEGGSEGFVQAMAASVEVGLRFESGLPMAMRGDRLALLPTGWVSAPGDRIDHLTVVELAEDGRLLTLVTFDLDARSDAVQHLDERYLTHLDELERFTAQGCLDLRDALASGSDSAIAALFHGDAEVIDHRTWVSTASDPAVVALDVRGSVAIELTAERWSVLVWRAGQIARAEHFDVAVGERARARCAEFASAQRTALPDNMAVRAGVRAAWLRDFAGVATLHNDVIATVAPEIVEHDHRRGVNAGVIAGRDAWIANQVAVFKTLDSAGTVTPLAVRGERLVLSKISYVTNSGYVLEAHNVMERDDLGRLTALDLFDGDDLGSAVAHLDLRHAELRTEPESEIERLTRLVGEAYNRNDFASLRSLCSPDLEAIDHAPLGFGRGGRDELARVLQTQGEVAADAFAYLVRSYVRGDVQLDVTEVRGAAGERGHYEWRYFQVRVAEGGVLTRFESFGPDQWDEALACFDELTSGSAGRSRPTFDTLLDTLAARATARLSDAVDANDWDAVRAMTHPEFVRTDHRSGVAGEVLRGPDAWVAAGQSVRAVGLSIRTATVAVRGERCELNRSMWERDGFEIPILMLFECDEHGLLIAAEFFDEGALGAAFDALEVRYLAGEGAIHRDAIVRRLDAGRVEESSDAFAALLSAAVQITNHRRFGWSMHTVDDLMDRVRGDEGLATRLRTITPWQECRGNVTINVRRDRLVTQEGNEYEVVMVMVLRSMAGLIDTIDIFDPEDFDAAYARFEALALEPPRAGVLDNRAVSAWVRMQWLAKFGFLDEFFDRLHPDVVERDHRVGVNGGEIRGRESVAENFAAMVSMWSTWEFTPLVVRGERFALQRFRGVSESGFEIEGLVVQVIDADARMREYDVFDIDDVDGALQSLEDRYCDTLSAKDAYVVRRLGDAIRAYARHDVAAGAALMAPEVVATNHRTMGMPVSGRDDYMASTRSLASVVPDVRMWHRAIEVRGDAVLLTTEFTGSTTDGADYEWGALTVLRTLAGRTVSMDFYDADDWDAARARFAELAGQPADPTVPDNPVVRTLVRAHWLAEFDRGPERSRYLRAMWHDDVVSIDHRAGVGGETVRGRDAVNETIRQTRGVFGRIIEVPMAVRGDRLALLRLSWTTEGGFESSMWSLYEADADGAIVRVEFFDDADRLRADAALEERAHEVGSGD